MENDEMTDVPEPQLRMWPKTRRHREENQRLLIQAALEAHRRIGFLEGVLELLAEQLLEKELIELPELDEDEAEEAQEDEG